MFSIVTVRNDKLCSEFSKMRICIAKEAKMSWGSALLGRHDRPDDSNLEELARIYSRPEKSVKNLQMVRRSLFFHFLRAPINHQDSSCSTLALYCSFFTDNPMPIILEISCLSFACSEERTSSK